MLIFALGTILVYLVLAAKYESWKLPLAVILVVPLCVLAAVTGMAIASLPIDIFVQIGLLVLIGLASKNAILIVEFARQLRLEGTNLREAAIQASRIRFRPIIMTSLAFIFGVLPLVLATGAGRDAPIAGHRGFQRHDRGDAVRHLPDACFLLRSPLVRRSTKTRHKAPPRFPERLQW